MLLVRLPERLGIVGDRVRVDFTVDQPGRPLIVAINNSADTRQCISCHVNVARGQFYLCVLIRNHNSNRRLAVAIKVLRICVIDFILLDDGGRCIVEIDVDAEIVEDIIPQDTDPSVDSVPMPSP